MAKPGKSRDLHEVVKGKRVDERLHDEILAAAPGAVRSLADAAISRAIDQGLTPEQAGRLYGTRRRRG